MKFRIALAIGVALALSGCGNEPELNKADFVNKISEFRGDYESKLKSGGNEAALSGVRIGRRSYLEAISKSFVSWPVIRSSLSTDSDRVATVSFVLDESSEKKNQLFGNDGITLWAKIDPDDPIYNEISKTKYGQKLSISGKFIVDGEDDYIDEKSFTEHGAVSSPEFSIKLKALTL